jgi:hypothetical protein
MQVIGDSKPLMDWGNSISKIANILLAPIMSLVLEVKQSFDDISFFISIENTIQEHTSYLKKLCQCKRGPYLFRSLEKGLSFP